MDINVQPVCNFLIERKFLDESDKLFFIYALRELIHTVIIAVSIMYLGIWFHHIQAATVFIIIFPIIRKYIGGIHAFSRMTCYITTVYMFLFCLWVQDISNALLLFALSTLSVKYIYFYAPAEQLNWILNLSQKANYKDSGQKIILILWGLGTLFLYCKNNQISKSIFTILILSGVNLFLQRYKIIRKDSSKTNRFLNTIVIVVISFGPVSIHSTCGHWNYQPELDANLRSYIDN